MDRQRKALFQAVRLSAPLTALALGVWSLGENAAQRAYERYALAQAYKDLTDSTELLAAHVRTELAGVMEQMHEHAQAKLLPVVTEAQTPVVSRAPASLRTAQERDAAVGWGYFEGPRDWLDLSLWGKAASPSAGLGGAQRIYSALNTRYSEASADLPMRLRATEGLERELASVVLLGHSVAASEPLLSGNQLAGSGVLWLGIPQGNRAQPRALVAHVRLERFQGAFRRKGDRRIAGDAAPQFALVDSAGNVLAHPDFRLAQRRDSWARHPAYVAAKRGEPDSGTLAYDSVQGVPHLGGYTRVGLGQLAVIASVPRADALMGMGMSVLPLWTWGLLCFIFVASLSYFYYSGDWRWAWELLPRGVRSLLSRAARALWRGVVGAESVGGSAVVGVAAVPSSAAGSGAVSPAVAPALKRVAVIHGSLRHVQDWIGRVGVEPAAEALNEFLTIASHRVRGYGGRFERSAGASFLATFGLESAEENETWCALRCALEIRADLFGLNESRRTDGEPLLAYGLGVHTGEGLVARIGPAEERRLEAVGEVTHYARALDQYASRVGEDLLASAAAWAQSESRFQGEPVAEARLTDETGLCALYGVRAYVAENGEVVSVAAHPVERESQTQETRFLASGADARWLVNNGSQIEGPLTASEIAARLFSQELDFDSECWKEGSGARSEIGTSSIFSGSNDAGASLWVYDGSVLHGPLSVGFLQTAIQHGALSADHHVCEGSTVAGWSRVEEFLTRGGVAVSGTTMGKLTSLPVPAAGQAPDSESSAPDESGSPQAA